MYKEDKINTKNGFFQKAKNFFSYHLKEGEKHLFIEQYNLKDIVDHYEHKFDNPIKFKQARSEVIGSLMQEEKDYADQTDYASLENYLRRRTRELFNQKLPFSKKEGIFSFLWKK